MIRALPGILGEGMLADEGSQAGIVQQLEDPAQVAEMAARYEADEAYRAQFNAQVAKILAPPPEEVTIEELNAALKYMEQSGMDEPDSVYDLTNLPALQGKVFPVLPEGQYFIIDPEKNQVVIEIDHRPEKPAEFPHQDPF